MTDSAVRSLVSPSDIAEMTGKSRAAVSNWRKRHDDFPKRVDGSDAKPLFDRFAVEAWLKQRGYNVTRDQGEKHAWAAMNALRGELDVSDAGNLFLTLCCLRKWTDQTGASMDLRNMLSSLSNIRYELQDQLRLMTSSLDIYPERLPHLEFVEERLLAYIVEDVWQLEPDSLGSIADYILERLARSQIKSGAEFGFVGSRTATLLSNLAVSTFPNASIYDPACGVAVGLIRSYESGASQSKLYGSEIKPQVYQWAKMRMYLHDVPIELAHGDSIFQDPFPNLKADVVILEPPFGMKLHEPTHLLSDARFAFGMPPRSSADLAWVQIAVSHLDEDGTAFVLTPAGPLFRERQEQSIRTELVRRGCVRAIVGLPAKMLPQTSIPLYLWVLRAPNLDTQNSEISFFDASNAEMPEELVPLVLAGREMPISVPHKTVPVTDVLAKGARLTPESWLDNFEIDHDELRRSLASGLGEITESLEGFRSDFPTFDPFKELGEPNVHTIGELVDLGVIELVAGKPLESYENQIDLPEDRYVSISDVRHRPEPLNGAPVAKADSSIFSRPGDVFVATTNAIHAWFDSTGGYVPGSGVFRLRVTDGDVINPAYLQVAIGGPWNNRFLTGSTIKRASIRDLEIPVMDEDDQESIWMALQWFHGIIDGAQQLASGAHQMRDALLTAMRYGIDIKVDLPS